MEDIFFREGTSAVLFRCCRRAFSTIEDGIPISDLYITLTYMENSFDLCWKKLWLKFASEEKYKLWGIPLILTLKQILYSFFLHLFFEICSCQFSTVLWERKSEENYVGLKIYNPARALRALGLLLADGAPTVGGGKTFWADSRIFLRKQL